MAFCASCGTQMAYGVAFCPNCGNAAGQASGVGASPAPAPASVADSSGTAAAVVPSSQAAEKVKARFQDGLRAFKVVVVNPVGGLPVAFEAMEKRQALEVGLVFAAVFELCTIIGIYLILPRWAGSPYLGTLLKIVIFGLIPFAAIAGGSALARQVFRGFTGGIEGDAFIAGASVLPFGFVSLLAGILGAANFEVVAIAGIFALTYTILVLFTGCVRISGIAEGSAASAVAIIIVVAGWFSKIMFASLL